MFSIASCRRDLKTDASAIRMSLSIQTCYTRGLVTAMIPMRMEYLVGTGCFEVSFREGSLSGPDQYGMIECWGWVVGKRNAVCFSYPQGFAVEVPLLQACLAHRILRIQS